jgi:hypothetical protein
MRNFIFDLCYYSILFTILDYVLFLHAFFYVYNSALQTREHATSITWTTNNNGSVRALDAGGSLTAPRSSEESKPPTTGLNYCYILRNDLLILWMEITAVYCEWYVTGLKALSTPSRPNIRPYGICTRSYHCVSQPHRIAVYPSIVLWTHRR